MAANKSSDFPRLNELLCFAVYSTGHAFNRLYKPLLDDIGLTYPQYIVMVVLWDEDNRTVSQLGDLLSLESNTLTPLLKRLEQLGHVTRNRDPEDERQVRVRLTPKGLGLRTRARNIPDCVVKATGRSLSSLRRLQGDLVDLRDTLTEGRS